MNQVLDQRHRLRPVCKAVAQPSVLVRTRLPGAACGPWARLSSDLAASVPGICAAGGGATGSFLIFSFAVTCGSA